MIQTKKDLKFYIAADRIMNGYPVSQNIKSRIRESFIVGGGKSLIIKYLYYLRRYAYYHNNHTSLLSVNSILMFWTRFRLEILGVKLGFSIGTNSLGYGVVIPHYGTIVINEDARIGNFAVLHTSTCVAGGGKIIGDGLYLSTGSQIVGSVRLGDGVTIASHSLVNQSFGGNVLIAGSPSEIKRKDYPIWYKTERDATRFNSRVCQIEKIKKKMYG